MSTCFESELRELHAAGVLDEATASRAIALERAEVFSIFEELRAAMYGAVALITAGIGILIKENLDRLGPITIVAMLALAAAVCYASAIRPHLKMTPRSLGGDYILLLGALILSADLGYAESQFHWFGADWSRHLLLLAALHAVTAYLLDSRLVLSIALTSFASWIGVEHNFGNVFDIENAAPTLGWRALVCAGLMLGWRFAHRHLSARQQFEDVFEHFAANLAFWGTLAWCFNDSMRPLGALLLTGFAGVSIYRGLRRSQELFVVYGVAYLASGYSAIATQLITDVLGIAIVVLAVMIGAISLLWSLHGTLKERAT